MPKIHINTIEKIARENIRDTSKVDELMVNLRKMAAEQEQNRSKNSNRKVAVVIPPPEDFDGDGEYTVHFADKLEDIGFSKADLGDPLTQVCKTKPQGSFPVQFKCIFHSPKSY